MSRSTTKLDISIINCQNDSTVNCTQASQSRGSAFVVLDRFSSSFQITQLGILDKDIDTHPASDISPWDKRTESINAAAALRHTRSLFFTFWFYSAQGTVQPRLLRLLRLMLLGTLSQTLSTRLFSHRSTGSRSS